MASIAIKFNFKDNSKLKGEERDAFIATLSPRAATEFAAYKPRAKKKK